MRSADEAEESEFKTNWLAADEKAKIYVDKFLASADFGELKATQLLLEQLPESSILHLGNSMPVRYANLFSTKSFKKIQVNANRGTSGIDGIISTSVGQAKKTDKVLTCLVGDFFFFYDRNAFWNANLPNNLKIVLINNEGDNIFRIIDGPSKEAEVADYFVGKQTKTAELLAKEKMNVSGVNTHSVRDSRGRTAWMTFTVDVSDTTRLPQVLERVTQVAGVRRAMRK